jgi:hypothetical protein
MTEFFQHPVTRGALVGIVSLAIEDIRRWKSFTDAKFNFSIALWRWFQGAVTGAAAGAGLGAIS